MQTFYFYRLSASSDPTNYRYIGTTCVSISTRFSQHKYCAMHKSKRALPVHKGMGKHYQLGETILIEKIFECSEETGEENEIRLIQEYKDAGYKLLNLDKGGHGIITKEKREKSGIQRSIEAHEIPIYAIDPKTMTIGQEFPSISKAAEYFMFKSISSITNALNGGTKKSAGYYWVYKEDGDKGINKINTEPNLQSVMHPMYRFDFNGNLIHKYESGHDFERTSGVKNYNAAKNAIKNKTGYLDSFGSDVDHINVEEYHQIYYVFEEVTPNGEIVNKYHTQAEIVKKLNYNAASTCVAIKKGKPFPNGNYIRKIKDKI